MKPQISSKALSNISMVATSCGIAFGATQASAQTLMRFAVNEPVFRVREAGSASLLQTVAFGDSSRSQWVRPSGVSGFRCDPVGRTFAVVSSGNAPGQFVETLDGRADRLSGEDVTRMEDRILEAMRSEDLGARVSIESDRGHFEFIIEFPHAVIDNDPREDDQGEVVFFECGPNGADGWLKLEVVDEQGLRIGRSVVTDPIGKVATNPPTQIGGQRTEGVTIDLTLFGVREMRRLKVSRAYPGRDGMPMRYRGDRSPDFKILALETMPAGGVMLALNDSGAAAHEAILKAQEVEDVAHRGARGAGAVAGVERAAHEFILEADEVKDVEHAKTGG